MKTHTITVSDTTYEGWRTYLIDGIPAYCSGSAPEGCVALQAGATEVFIRESDLPDFRGSFGTDESQIDQWSKCGPIPGCTLDDHWTPQQYVIDCGWDCVCIEATAANGVSETDAERLTDEQQASLLAYCRETIAAAK